MPDENVDGTLEKKQLEIAREKGIIRPGEDVRACISLFNRSVAIMLAPPVDRFLLKRFLFVVTSERIVLMSVPLYLIHGGDYYKWAEHPLPCKFSLESEPKENHLFGNKVKLPDQLANLVGRRFGFVLRGKAAQQAFAIASNPK